MADNKLSKLRSFVFGSSVIDEPDDFSSDADFDSDSDDEVTDVVDYGTARRGPVHGVPSGSSVTSLDERRRPMAVPSASPSEIVHIRPKTYAEATTIGRSFAEGLPVILNMGLTDESQAIKLIDFCSGMAFVTGGTLEKITSRVFLLTPENMKFTEADKTDLAGQQYLRG